MAAFSRASCPRLLRGPRLVLGAAPETGEYPLGVSPWLSVGWRRVDGGLANIECDWRAVVGAWACVLGPVPGRRRIVPMDILSNTRRRAGPGDLGSQRTRVPGRRVVEGGLGLCGVDDCLAAVLA